MLIPCSQELVGSNPTPRAYLVVLSQNNKREKAKNSNCKGHLLQQPLKISRLNKTKDDTVVRNITNRTLNDKINSITNTCSESYFNKILQRLAGMNSTNAYIICKYIISEQDQLNIKNSTKEGKIKTLVWLSNFFEDKINFKQMSKENIFHYLTNGFESHSPLFFDFYFFCYELLFCFTIAFMISFSVMIPTSFS